MTNSTEEVHSVVFVLGPPGCGKGTQCYLIEQYLGFVHLSAGDLLRKEQERVESKFGKIIDEHIRNGTIVPVEITCKLIEKAMDERSFARGFLIDGFPRNQNNLDGWKREMADKTKICFVLYMACTIEECLERCLKRGQGRTDDNEQSLKKRIETYNNQTVPIIEYFQSLGLVREVSAIASLEEVFTNIRKIFQSEGFLPLNKSL